MWQSIDSKKIIMGKNAIENLTEGMYKNALIIYREYIQNAADAIDEAKTLGLYKNGTKPEIDIDVDPVTRKIQIYDNGIGVKNSDRYSLINVADSDKDKNKNKGFRGIGRLGGLAYCKTLRFTTTYPGENMKTIIEWDADMLMGLIHDDSVKLTSAEVIAKVVKIDEEEEQSELHYFRVELEGVRESKRKLIESTSDLVEKDAVKRYITQTAPIDYDTGFLQFSNRIQAYVAKNNFTLSTYNVNIDGSPIYKSYRRSLYYYMDNKCLIKHSYDEITDIRFKEFYTDNGELLAWMWYGISKFEKKIPENANSDIRGILLRKDNIQIGEGSKTIMHLHKEQYRGNDYFIGELQAVHKNLIPNSRRDYFIENDTLSEFESKVSEFFVQKLYELYQTASEARGYYSAIEAEEKLNKRLQEKSETGFITTKESERLNQDLEKAHAATETKLRKFTSRKRKNEGNKDIELTIKLNEMAHKEKLGDICDEKSVSHTNNLPIPINKSSNETYGKSINEPKDMDKISPTTISSDLLNLTKKERKIVDCVYSVIYEILPNEESESLIKKIQNELLKL